MPSSSCAATPRSLPTLRHGGGPHRSPASSAPFFKQRSSTIGCGSRRSCGWRSSTPRAAPPSTLSSRAAGRTADRSQRSHCDRRRDVRARRVGRAQRRIPPRAAPDALIAAAAAEHGAIAVLHRDAHFDRLAAVLTSRASSFQGPDLASGPPPCQKEKPRSNHKVPEHRAKREPGIGRPSGAPTGPSATTPRRSPLPS